jgi:uncharacterized membrane protein
MAPAAPLAESPGHRVETIDAVRGLVMILMALDHVRDFVHRAAMSSSPTDLAVTTPALFLTRWVTHLCAPTFMFTAGVGAYFWWRRGRSARELSTYLVTRGLWLIVLEVTVMRLAYNFTFAPRYPVFLLVLWALGACMIGLAALARVPLRALAVLSLLTIALHNMLDGADPARLGSFAPLWNLLHRPGAFSLAGTTFIVAYPLVPWIAVMTLGFCVGPVFLLPRETRRRRLAIAGVAATLGFLALRGLSGYGDPAPWSAQDTPVLTALSFLNTTKYPPSLHFLLMTLGPALLLLAWLDRPSLRAANPLVIFGRVPLFYFVLHFFAAHAAAVLLAFLRYGPEARGFAFHPLPSMGAPAELFPPDFGYDLWVVYAVWIGIVLLLYPLCRWFAGLKARRGGAWWLGYL